MRDAQGEPAATALWPLQWPLHALLKYGEVYFIGGGLKVYVDKCELMSSQLTVYFLSRREAILDAFVAHFAAAFDRETVVAQVVQAEQGFLA
jgi:hypothetical protein